MTGGAITRRRFKFPNGRVAVLHRLGDQGLCPVCGAIAGDPFSFEPGPVLPDGTVCVPVGAGYGSYDICRVCRVEYGCDCELVESDIVEDGTGDTDSWRQHRYATLRGQGRTPELYAALTRIDREPDLFFVNPVDVAPELVLAAAAGDPGRVSAAIAAGGGVDVADWDGWSGLHWVAATGRAGIALILLHAGAAPDFANARGETPLMTAALRGHVEVLQALLSSGADVAARTSSGSRPSVYGMCPAEGSRVGGRTALHWGASGGVADVISALCAAGADVEAIDDAGLRPLMVAGAATAVTALLGQGAAVDARDPRGLTALLHAACVGPVDVVEALMSAGADAKATTDWRIGHNALSLAMDGTRSDWPDKDVLSLMDALLKGGADPNFPASDRMLPLEFAARQGDPTWAARLLDAGADINAHGWHGKTALHSSLSDCGGNREAVTRLLLQAGADPNARDDRGTTPLMTAAAGRRAPRLEMLLAAGARVHDADKNSRTALHYAAKDGEADAVARLLSAGADRTARSGRGDTPLDVARRRGRQNVVALLTLDATSPG